MKDFLIPVGLFKDTDKYIDGHQSGRKLVRKVLTWLHVPFYDGCCTTASPANIFPVRYNAATGLEEYFNGTAWVATGQGAISGLNSFTGPLVQNASSPTGSAINATATATAAQVKTGLITSTSAAATSITLPTATQLATALGAVKGTSFEFIVDNSAGANTVTVIVGTGITTASALTGGTTLTVVNGASGVAVFRLIFKSTTTANLARIV